MSLTSLRPVIMSKLTALTGAGQPLAFVDDKHHSNMGGYPAATFEPSDLPNDFFTNTDNKHEYSFTIIVHQEMQTVGRSEAIRILNIAVDALIAAFDADYTLGGAADYCKALPAHFDEYVSGNGPIKCAILTYTCVSEVAI